MYRCGKTTLDFPNLLPVLNLTFSYFHSVALQHLRLTEEAGSESKRNQQNTNTIINAAGDKSLLNWMELIPVQNEEHLLIFSRMRNNETDVLQSCIFLIEPNRDCLMDE